MSDNPNFLGFYAFFIDFFRIQGCFVDCKAKFYIKEMFFLEEWFFGFAKS